MNDRFSYVRSNCTYIVRNLFYFASFGKSIMPAGIKLTKMVERELSDKPMLPYDIQNMLMLKTNKLFTSRAIRYALQNLIAEGKARRIGVHGPVLKVEKVNEPI